MKLLLKQRKMKNIISILKDNNASKKVIRNFIISYNIELKRTDSDYLALQSAFLTIPKRILRDINNEKSNL